MLGASLVLLVALGQVQEARPDQDPAALVAQLGAARYADRQAAAEALERIGRPALAALREARNSRDLEVKTRALSLAAKIEGALLTQPTRVRLDFDNALMADVTKALTKQTGFKIAIFPPNLPKWRYQRVTLHGSQPVDFWKAVDQVCDAGGLQYNPNMHGFGGEREPVFAFTDGSARTLMPTSDFGPFRVSLLGVDYQRHVSYTAVNPRTPLPPPPRPAGAEPPTREKSAVAKLRPVTTVQFSAQLTVAAEPRLSLSYQHGALQLTEAVDERGNSLVPIGNSGPASRSSIFPGMMNAPLVQIAATLQRPAGAGETIKKLRGNIPLVVSSRRPDPLVIPLASAAGKTFENPEVQLIVHEIRAVPNSTNSQIELTVWPSDREASSSQGDAEGSRFMMPRPYRPQLQIEVTDVRGQLIPWFQSGADVDNSRFTITVTNSQPSELRYYALTQSAANVPFEFTDIPMP
jgi:hypothetical protein